jgi:hypothetical protein
MTCRKVCKLMPLVAGDDLGPRRTRAVLSHVDACPACRRELGALREALARMKAAAREEAVPDWSEGEWKALMVRATAQAGTGAKGAAVAGTAPWPRWAAASAAGVLVGLVVLGVLVRGPAPRPEGRSAAGGRTGEPAAAVREQDVVAMTMVSQETGLQVVWFLDRNFDYKGEQE